MHLIQRKLVTPTAVTKWEEHYFYVNFDWKHIFRVPYSSVRETSFQSMQYQILNRHFPWKEILSIWYSNDDKMCDYCEFSIDCLEHYFYYSESF